MSSAQTQITDLPAAQPLTGSETVPIVQGGVTVRTTTGAISGAGSLNYPFLTVGSTAGLTDARQISTSTGLSLTDNGAGNTLQINLTGAALSLDSSGTGIQVKTGPNTLTGRSMAVGAGLGITNSDGVSGDPTIILGTFLSNFVSLTGTGILAIQSGNVGKINILGTTNQISISNGDGSGDVTVSLASNPVLPGTGGVVIPLGTTVQQPSGTPGQFRFNTDTQTFDGYASGSWKSFSLAGGVTTFSAGSTGLTPAAATSGVVTLGGTLNVSSGGTGANTLTGYLVGNGTSAVTAVATIPNAGLTNDSVTYNGVTVALGASGTITAANPNALTIGTGLNGGSYDGSTPITIAIDSTVATLTGTQTLTNKSMSGSSNTFTNIPNNALTNNSVTFNGSTVALGGSATITASTTNALTIGTGLTGTSFNGGSAVTIAIDSTVATLTGTQTLTNKSISGSTNTLSNIPNSALTNSSLTIGSTAISLGGTSLTLAGLTSVTLTQDPTLDLQAATKQYVDNLVSTGLAFHQPVQAATTASLASTTGGTVTYNNGTGGVGATITLSVALTTVDGYSPTNTNRILVKDEPNQAYNGIYTWATGGTVLTRATDADTYGSGVNQLSQNDYFFVQNGTVNKGSSFVVTTVGTITFGTTAITFAEFSNSQVYTAGTGLTLTGTTFSISNTGVTNATYGTASSVPTLAINAQGQVTSASNTAIAINGNQITSGTVGSSYISGSYTGITGVGTLTAGTWNASAISDTYLSTISTAGKVSNSATTATSANTASAIVARDASGNFSAGTITATLSGNASTATSATTATNIAGGTAGAIAYNTGSGATTFLTLGTSNYVLTAGATAPQYVAQSTLSVGSATNATNATNTAITANSTNATNYLTFVSATTGNLPQLINSNLTVNPSTGQITGGVAGGSF